MSRGASVMHVIHLARSRIAGARSKIRAGYREWSEGSTTACLRVVRTDIASITPRGFLLNAEAARSGHAGGPEAV